MNRCIKAMSFVYGDFDTLSDEQCQSWMPPSEPGTGGQRGRRLWTDAFGLVNFTTLFVLTGHRRYLILANRLAQAVHDVLGRARDGNERLPGATDARPLQGGLRSGRAKKENDGQVHRDLAMWMFALDRLGRANNDATNWNQLAVSLGEAIHPRFTVHTLSGGMRLVGRVSNDMEDVLDVQRGEADAIMGWAVFRTVRDGVSASVLGDEIKEYESATRSGKGDEDVKWLGMGLWLSALWRGERWSDEMGKQAMKNVGKVLEDSTRTLPKGDDLEDRAVGELGACLGVKCWLGGNASGEHEKGMLETTDRIIKLWEARLENQLEAEVKGVVAAMAGAALMPGGEYITGARHTIRTTLTKS